MPPCFCDREILNELCSSEERVENKTDPHECDGCGESRRTDKLEVMVCPKQTDSSCLHEIRANDVTEKYNNALCYLWSASVRQSAATAISTDEERRKHLVCSRPHISG